MPLVSVLLLLSIFVVRGSGCDGLEKGTVRNLQDRIRYENSTGFLQVFPKNYVVPHFNASAQCLEKSATCCVFSEAVLLSRSWAQLLQHLARYHLKHTFITELKLKLDAISVEGFQETPDLSAFPSVNSSPKTLLAYTFSLLSKWLELNCPPGEKACVFSSPFTSEEEQEEEEEMELEKEIEKEVEEKAGGEETSENLPFIEGERGKRWITVIPTNGHLGLSTSPTLVLSALYLLYGW